MKQTHELATPPLPRDVTVAGRPTDDVRTRIPGWGVDLDPEVRPSVPRERFDLPERHARSGPIERQPELWPRERSIEYATLTPVFGTACPPRLISGVMRRHAYRAYSEARAAHWLMLIAADRVDAFEQHVASFLSLRPDNPITETGVRSEASHHGYSSRVGRGRTDLVHQMLDPVVVAGPWIAAGYGVVKGVRGLARRMRGASNRAAA